MTAICSFRPKTGVDVKGHCGSRRRSIAVGEKPHFCTRFRNRVTHSSHGDQAMQISGTATLWKRCGEATAEDGYAESFAWKSGFEKAARKAAVDSQTA
jgi:hypothetical protein